MPDSPPEGINQTTTSLPIDRLDPHPLNSNVMPKALLDKLANEIGRNGLYPPIIVRPVGERYQVLDGHHRVRVLRQLGHRTAQANIWPVDDKQAMLFLASLNRMRGEDDPHKRAALLDRLRQNMGIADLARRLPEDTGRVKKMLELHSAPPSPKPPQPVDQMPVCLTFFVLPEQRKAIEQRLREHGGSREQALLDLLDISEDLYEMLDE